MKGSISGNVDSGAQAFGAVDCLDMMVKRRVYSSALRMWWMRARLAVMAGFGCRDGSGEDKWMR